MHRTDHLTQLARRSGIFAFMLVAMLVFGDQFPFSNFPMYSVLPGSLITVRLTDEQGNLLPSVPAFNVGTTIIKKNMGRELHEMKEKKLIQRIQDAPLEASRKAGQIVLDWLLKTYVPQDPRLSGAVIKLEQTTYTAHNGSITQKVDVLAEGMAREAVKK